jgi:hypothetical protein
MEKIVLFTCAYSPADWVSEGAGLANEGEDIEVIETSWKPLCLLPARSLMPRRSFSFNF